MIMRITAAHLKSANLGYTQSKNRIYTLLHKIIQDAQLRIQDLFFQKKPILYKFQKGCS